MLRTPLGVLALAVAAIASRSAHGQSTPRFAAMTTSRIVLVPAQEVNGASDSKAWLARFDSVLTARLESGGIADGWTYPRDTERFARQNPTYVSNPHLLGAQPLKSGKVKAGTPLPEPLASRLRMLVAVPNAREVLLPVVALLDSTVTPRVARLVVVYADARTSAVLASWSLDARYAGNAAVAADSLAYAFARLFVAN